MKNFCFKRRDFSNHSCLKIADKMMIAVSFLIKTSSLLHGQTRVEMIAGKEAVKQIVIADATGRKIQSYTWKTISGLNKFIVSTIGKLQRGMYYIIMRNSEGVVTGTYKLIKE